MLTLFWDERGVILKHYMPRGNTVNSATYADLLKNHLCPAIKSKRHGLLGTGVLLQHDNAHPHTAHSTIATIQDLSFECLPHLLYSPDLASSDFHVFGPLKEAMGGKSLRSNESRRCMSGCALSQKTFFLEVSMHFRSAGTLIWYTMETT
jgi:histone-lysine N-methyltransferase SETMAR